MIFCRIIDMTNEWLGRAVAWLLLAMLIVQFAVVIMRYVFGLGSLMMQESLVYLHATVFLLAVGYGLKHEAHVRIDIFYQGMSARRRALVNALGVILLLLPVSVVVFWKSFPYVANSWRTLEGSSNLSGIPAVFLLKSLILLFAVLLALQGAVLLCRSLLVIAGRRPA